MAIRLLGFPAKMMTTSEVRHAVLPLLVALLSLGCASSTMELPPLSRVTDCAEPSRGACPEVCPPGLFLIGCPDDSGLSPPEE